MIFFDTTSIITPFCIGVGDGTFCRIQLVEWLHYSAVSRGLRTHKVRELCRKVDSIKWHAAERSEKNLSTAMNFHYAAATATCQLTSYLFPVRPLGEYLDPYVLTLHEFSECILQLDQVPV